MSLFYELMTAHGVPALVSAVGTPASGSDAVTLWPLGSSANAVIVQGDWQEEEATYNRSRGKENVRKIQFRLPDSITVPSAKHVWFRNSVTYTTESFRDERNGFLVFTLIRADIETRKLAGGSIL